MQNLCCENEFYLPENKKIILISIIIIIIIIIVIIIIIISPSRFTQHSKKQFNISLFKQINKEL